MRFYREYENFYHDGLFAKTLFLERQPPNSMLDRVLHLDLGRQTGKTTFIARESRRDDVVIAPARLARVYLSREFNTDAKIFLPNSYQELASFLKSVGQPSRIFIDEPKYTSVSLDMVKLACNQLGYNKTIIVCLGEL